MKQFKLEEKIMACWQVVDDIEVLYKACEGDDEVQNVLLGLMSLYELKFQELFATFEDSLK